MPDMFKILDRLKLTSVTSLTNPYKGEALETYHRVTKDVPNPYYNYTLYLCKEANKLYYITKGLYLHYIEFDKNAGRVGFFVYKLTKKNTLESDGTGLWWESQKDFTEVIKRNNFDDFYHDVIKAIEGMKVQSRSDSLLIYEKIKAVFDSYKK